MAGRKLVLEGGEIFETFRVAEFFYITPKFCIGIKSFAHVLKFLHYGMSTGWRFSRGVRKKVQCLGFAVIRGLCIISFAGFFYCNS